MKLINHWIGGKDWSAEPERRSPVWNPATGGRRPRMAYYSFGGWNASLFGDKHIHGPEGVSFYTRAKVVTTRWPQIGSRNDAMYSFPTAN